MQIYTISKIFPVFLAGVILGFNVPVHRPLIVIVTAVTVTSILLLALSICFYKALLLYRIPWLNTLTGCVAVFWLSVLFTLTKRPESRPDIFTKQTADSLCLQIVGDPTRHQRVHSFEALVLKCWSEGGFKSSSGKLRVSIAHNGVDPLLKKGQLVMVKNCWQTVREPANPYDFDYRYYLFSRGISAQIYLQPNEWHATDSVILPKIEKYIDDIKYQFNRLLSADIYDPYSRELLKAIILGDKRSLPEELKILYSRTGVAHVLAVSGMHVSLLMMIVSYVLIFMRGGRRSRYIAILISLCCVLFYAFLTGLQAPVCRALIMVLITSVGSLLRRDVDPLNTLCVTAMTLIIWSPYALLNVGFQFSFAAMFGIVLLYPPISGWWRPGNRLLLAVWKTMAISISAQVTTLPLVLYYFNQFPTYFILSNLLIAVPIIFFMALGVITFVIPIPLVSMVLAKIISCIVNIMNGGLSIIESLPGAVMHFVRMPFWYYVLLYVIIFCLSYAVIKRYKKITAYILLAIIAVCPYCLRVYKLKHNSSIGVFFTGKEVNVGLFDKGEAVIISNSSPESPVFKQSVMREMSELNMKLVKVVKPNLSDSSLSFAFRFFDYRVCVFPSDSRPFARDQDRAVAILALRDENEKNKKRGSFLFVLPGASACDAARWESVSRRYSNNITVYTHRRYINLNVAEATN